MATTVNIPVKEYISLIECRAKLAIIKSYIRKRLWSIFTDDMDHCMYTGYYGVERHHIFSHTHKERMLCEKYGFIAPLRPDLHPNGVHAGKEAPKIWGCRTSKRNPNRKMRIG